MAKKKRIWYPGAVYHITNRGNRRSDIFRDEGILVIDDGSLELIPNYPIDFSDVKGQDVLIEYIIVAAAGGHNMLMPTLLV